MSWRDRTRRNTGGAAGIGEAEARRARSIARLRSEGIPVLETLPTIETEEGSVRRTASEVARRALALAAVAVKGEAHGEASSDDVMTLTRDVVEQFELGSAFTPAERSFIEEPGPSEVDRVQFTWRYECYWTLLWALEFVEALGQPSQICDPATAIRIMHDLGKNQFLERSQLRPQADLLDEADLIYRYDWAVVNAGLKGATVPGLDGGVVVERHYALNWLIGYQGEEWDDISTDT